MKPHESAATLALHELETEDDAVISRIALEEGPPSGADRLSERDEDEAWETTDDSVDYEMLAQILMTQGLPPEQAQQLLLVKLRPEWAPVFAQPTQDAERAHQLARLAQYPFRLTLLEDLDDYDEQVAKAETLDRRFQKRLVQRQAEAVGPLPLIDAPMPAMPPTMPIEQPQPPVQPAPAPMPPEGMV